MESVVSFPKNIGGGLTEYVSDDRDFSLGAMYDTPVIIPDQDFIVAPIVKIKDQESSDLCTSYALTAVSEDQEGIELSPEFTFAKTKELMGTWQTWGASLRDACRSAVKIGFLEQQSSPYVLSRDGRNTVANWENWDKKYDMDAISHKKEAFFSVDGQYDMFDNIRATLWRWRNEKRSIATGIKWRSEWTDTKAGVLPIEYGLGQYGHAFKVCGQKNIFNKWYLIAQLSNGTSIGNQGMFYMPREVVNKEFNYGAYMFKDLPENIGKDQAIEKSMLYRKGIVARTWFFFNKAVHTWWDEVLR